MQNDNPLFTLLHKNRGLIRKMHLLQNVTELVEFLQTMSKEQISEHKSIFEQAVAGATALSTLVGLCNEEND